MQQEKQKKSTEAKLYCKINLKIDIAVRAFSNLPLPPLVLQLTTLIQQIDIQKVKYLLCTLKYVLYQQCNGSTELAIFIVTN